MNCVRVIALYAARFLGVVFYMALLWAVLGASNVRADTTDELADRYNRGKEVFAILTDQEQYAVICVATNATLATRFEENTPQAMIFSSVATHYQNKLKAVYSEYVAVSLFVYGVASVNQEYNAGAMTWDDIVDAAHQCAKAMQ